MEKIGIIGIGRLGLCLALNLEKAGYEVIGVDVSKEYVTSLNDKTFKSTEPLVNDYLQVSERFIASNIIEAIIHSDSELIFIVLPTPSLANGSFDHSIIDDVMNEMMTYGKQSKIRHIIINSTTIPGYCDSLQLRMQEFNYTISYNPEFIAQGSIIENQQFPDQVLIGEGSVEAGDIIQSVYSRMCKNKPVYCRMSRISAEITKLATNCFLTTKISYANAIGDLTTRAGGEPDKVLHAIGIDSRIGNKYFKYGFGYGGPCFPRDNKAFIKFAADHNFDMLISKATDEANELHNAFLFEQWTEKYKNEEYILFESVTYKKGTDIIEESQQLKLALTLAKSGKKVRVRENAFVIKALIDLYGDLFVYEIAHT